MTAQARGGRSTTGRAAAKKTVTETTPAAQKPDPDVVWVDLNNMTAAEYEAVEELSGLPVARAMDVQKPQGSIQRAMGWVVKIRDVPEMPFEDEDCGRGVRPRCGDCHCSRRLKVFVRISEAPVPPSGENGSST
jgi:hypothetical protein